MTNLVLVQPDRPYTVCRIAQCYDRLKNKEKAKEWAQKAIKLRAQDPEVEEVGASLSS